MSGDGDKGAWGYVRLSGEGREKSLEEQRRSIREYARENGLNLQTTRNDGENTSGFDADRHEYQLLRGKVVADEIDAVITRDRPRLARDFDERLELITIFREVDVEWHVVEAGGRLQLEDVQQAGFECVHAMWDHYKKMIEIQRSRAAIEERKENGCYQGRPPTGLQFADNGCNLERSDRWEDIVTAFEMLENGASNSEVAEEVGIPNVTTLRRRGFGYYKRLVEEYGV